MPPALDPAAIALEKCEAIMHKLGAQMTFGGEVEWYFIPNKKFSEPIETTRQKMLAAIRENASAMIGLEGLGKDALTEMQTMVRNTKSTNISLEEAVIGIAEKTFSDENIQIMADGDENQEAYTSEQMRIVTIIAKTYGECARAGIELNKDFKSEAGGVRSGDSDFTVSMTQHEISTAIADAPTTAKWLDQLRSILAKNSKECGFESDFRDKPPYTIAENEAGSGLHIHYGLVASDASKTNLMHAGSDTPSLYSGSRLYQACAEGVSEVLNQGGIALCCTSDNAYKRLSGNPAAIIIGSGHDKQYAIESALCNNVLHQELRVPGANTKGSYAVLVAALGMVHGISQELGLGNTSNDHIDAWRARIRGDSSNTDKLDEILNEIQPTHVEALQSLSKIPQTDSTIQKGNVPSTLLEAKERGCRGSLLQAYCPLVAQEIEALSGKTNKWNL